MTGSLDVDARPTPDGVADDHTPPVRHRSKRRWFWWVVLGVAALAVVVAVIAAGLWVREVETGPTELATVWVGDMADGRSEQALQQVCAEGAARHPTGESLRAEFERLLGGRVATVRPGEQVISNGPQGASVFVPFSGVLSNGSSTRFEIKVVREDGRWLVCGYR